MTDTAPTGQKAESTPIQASPVPTVAATAAPPAQMSGDKKTTENKAEATDEPGATGDDVEATAKEPNGAPEAVMEEPNPASVALGTKEPQDPIKQDEMADGPGEKKSAEANDDPKDVEMKDAAEPESKTEPEPGEKRKADQQSCTNGDTKKAAPENSENSEEKSPEVGALAPTVKKQKINGTEELVPRKTSRRKKEKKAIAPVGRTERRTRSQGLV
ncbi:hypothetical protein MKZ38_001401 [Zalerion maritima]|uniref:Uncharacterized protein n=1 Tax=Zalerion maritima TaxID=339359 RepID=A0AAD5WRY8_9PEZI|nr:hypothetical protein MKZ38_001401 [Zalerion maritima]